MNEGQRKQQNGTQVSAPSTRQTDQWEYQKKRWEDDINELLKPEETEETKGNEIKNNDTCHGSKLQKIEKDGKQWKVNTQRPQPQYLLTVCTAEGILRKIQFLVEQGVQKYQILFVWCHGSGTRDRRARFLIHVGDLM